MTRSKSAQVVAHDEPAIGSSSGKNEIKDLASPLSSCPFRASPARWSSAKETVAAPSRCKWALEANEEEEKKKSELADPHHHVRLELSINPAAGRIHGSILEAIGWTPLVRVHNLERAKGLKCQLMVKCEFMNPGGSVKDRVAVRMLDEAERSGQVAPHSGYTIIEPTSGNTGIGLALCAAVRGYRCLIVMPDKMSREKESLLRALGAEIIRTPSGASYDHHQSHISRALELNKQLDKSIILNQHRNSANPLAHYDSTAEEILLACDNQLDLLVAAAGTGGTITGLARKIKERASGCQIVGVDAVGSILSELATADQPAANSPAPSTSSAYELEGIGYDFKPTVLDAKLVDLWIKTTDGQSLRMARELIRCESLLVGGSSGAAVAAALEAIERLNWGQDATKRIVVMLPDGVRNYMSKLLDDHWMRAREFL